MPIITLRYAALCRECQAELKPGARVRYYGSGRKGGIYGIDCHKQQESKTTRKPDVYILPLVPR
jgi:hypothetical protein